LQHGYPHIPDTMLKAILAFLLCLSLQYVVCQDDTDDGVTDAPGPQDLDTTDDSMDVTDDLSTTDDSEDDLSTTDDMDSTESTDSDDSGLSTTEDSDSGSDSDDSSDISSTEDSDSGSDEEDSEDEDSEDEVSEDDDDSTDDDGSDDDDESDDESQDDNASDDDGEDVSSDDDDDDDETSEEDDQDTDDTEDDTTDNDDTTVDDADDDQCAGLAADDCSDNWGDDGAQVCALNIETNDCYEIVQSRGIYGKGNFDDGYNAAQAESAQATQQLNTVVGIMGGFIAVLVLIIVAGGYWVYSKQSRKGQMELDDDDDHYREDQKIRLSTAEDAEPMITAE